MDNENDIVTRSINDSDGKNKNKAIVVGAGVGGLGMASRLAFNGYKAVSYTHLTLPTILRV